MRSLKKRSYGLLALGLIIIIATIFHFNQPKNYMVEKKQEIKVGIILGFTGPIKSITPAMADSAELAFKEASKSGSLLGGSIIKIEKADSTCKNSSDAITAAKKLILKDVKAIIGADCNEVTKAIATNITIPNRIVMISPSATSPDLTKLNDNGFFFRTAPSDLRGSKILADITKERGIRNVAIAHSNNEYGKRLAYYYENAVKALDINVTVITSYKDDKSDYGEEVATLVAAGGDAVAIFGYEGPGSNAIIKGSIDSGGFDIFILSDEMIGNSVMDFFGDDLNKSFGLLPGSKGKGASLFSELTKTVGIDSSGPYTGESYDAAAVIVLAIQAGRSSDSNSIQKNLIDVTNSPGIKIYPGELKKALNLLAEGKKINYEGATELEFSDIGEALGSFLEKEIYKGKFETIKQR